MVYIAQVGVRNMVVFAAHIERPAPIGTEHLNTASKLGREVEVSCLKHAPVKIKESAAGSEEWLDASVMHPIHLRTDGASTSAIGILTSLRMPRVSDERHWDDVGNPANGEWPLGINQPTIAVF